MKSKSDASGTTKTGDKTLAASVGKRQQRVDHGGGRRAARERKIANDERVD